MKKTTAIRLAGTAMVLFILYVMGVSDQYDDALAMMLVAVVLVIELFIVPAAKERDNADNNHS